jgi:hypothetical protein
MIDGETVMNATASPWNERQPANSDHPPPQEPQRINDSWTCTPGQKNIMVEGIHSDYFHDKNLDMESDMAGVEKLATAVIRDGTLECIGKHTCRILAKTLVQEESFSIINLIHGVVTPIR